MRPSAPGPCLGLLLLSLAVASPLAEHAAIQQVSRDLAGWPIGDLELVDQRGNPFLNENLIGRWTLLAVADSRCGAPCAGTVAALSGLLRRIAGAKVIQTTQAVLVSFREEDRAAQLARLGASQEPGLIAVTGTPEGIAQLADDLGLSYPPPPEWHADSPGGEGHTGSIWLIGPDGVIRAELRPPFDVPLLTAAYLKLRLKG